MSLYEQTKQKAQRQAVNDFNQGKPALSGAKSGSFWDDVYHAQYQAMLIGDKVDVDM